MMVVPKNTHQEHTFLKMKFYTNIGIIYEKLLGSKNEATYIFCITFFWSKHGRAKHIWFEILEFPTFPRQGDYTVHLWLLCMGIPNTRIVDYYFRS